VPKTGDRTPPERISLRILATSDVHGHLLAWDYLSDRPAPATGLARIAALVRDLRIGPDVSLLVDNGDFLQGSALADAAARGIGAPPGAPHPVIAAMNAMGYDAAALGNHDFGHGLAHLLDSLQAARFPVLSANILTRRGDTPAEDATLLPGSTLIRRDLPGRPPLALGVLGLTPPRSLQWELRQIDRELYAREMVEAAEFQAADLRSRGADIVVALCHSGLGRIAREPDGDDAALQVARLPAIDAVVAGHTHHLFPNPALPVTAGFDPRRGLVQGRPVVNPGFNALHLGVIDLGLAHDGQCWRVRSARARLHPARPRGRTARRTADEDTGIRSLIEPAHAATRAWLAEPIARNPTRLTNHLSLVRPCSMLRLIARAKIEAVRDILAGGPEGALPVLASAAPYRAGGLGGPGNYSILPRGDLRMRQIMDLYPYSNRLVALRLTGAQVAEWLEFSAAIFHRIPPGGRDVPLIDDSMPCFGFDMVEGVSYRIDLSSPARYDAHGRLVAPQGRRILDLRLDGELLDPDRPVILATNSYRLSTTRAQTLGVDRQAIYQGEDMIRDILIDRLRRWGRVPDFGTPGWAFQPMPGTTAVFDSAPRAQVSPTPPGQPAIEPLGMTPDGFRRFRLVLG
jgi:2',3'-cyclic-nucleotide 2'-phosphodiesterase/3'-nucleotidase